MMFKQWPKLLLAGIALVASAGSVLYVTTANAGSPTPASNTGVGIVQSVQVPVSDLAVARDFYVNKLGFIVSDQTRLISDSATQAAVVEPVGGAVIVLTVAPDAGTLRGLGIRTIDCAGDAATLRSRGVDVPDCYEGPGGLTATFSDPDGNVWTLASCEQQAYAGTVSNLAVPVSDQDAALDFYVKGLGFAVLNDRQNPAPYTDRWIELAPPGSPTSISLATWFDTMPAGSEQGLTITTTNCAGTVNSLRAAGIDATDCANSTSSVVDPDGNYWTILQK